MSPKRKILGPKPVSAEGSNVAPPTQFLFGFRDRAGQTEIPARFEAVSEFSGKFAKAMAQGKWGIIDSEANWVAPPKFDFLGRIENDHVLFRRNQKWGVATLQGQETRVAEYDEIISVGKKLVTVRNSETISIVSSDMEMVMTDIEKAFSWKSGYCVLVVAGRAGIFGEDGKWLIHPSYDAIYDFAEGLAAYEHGGKSGYFDLTGAVAIPPQFEEAYDFSEGLARVRKDGKFGYINSKGEIVIQTEWADPLKKLFSGDSAAVTAFHNGFAKVARLRDNDRLEIGFIDVQGKWFEVDQVPQTTPPLSSFRELNPAWSEYQERLELGAKFEAQLTSFKKKLVLAMTKDAPRVKSALHDVITHVYPNATHLVKLIVSDLNGYDIAVYPCDAKGEENFDNMFQVSPIKAIQTLFEKGIMNEPKTAKGVELLEEFHRSCAYAIIDWICDIWKESGGVDFPFPAYIQNEDEPDFASLNTKIRGPAS